MASTTRVFRCTQTSVESSQRKINVKKGRRFDRSTVIFKFRSKKKLACAYREFSHDVTAAILVFQENPLGGELFSHVNALFCSKKLA